MINARKNSSAMSAAKAAVDHMRDWWLGTPKDEYVSMGIVSDGSYEVPKGLVFSFPVTTENQKWKIVQVSSIFVLNFLFSTKSSHVTSTR